MKTARTPGPWFVDPQGSPTIRTANGTPVCGAPRNIADAPLIAAAPTMLAALRSAECAVTELCQGQDPANECWVTLHAIRTALIEAEK